MQQQPAFLSVLQPGTELKGRYRVVRVVGGGGMATVYRVEEIGPNPGHSWALKELRAISAVPAEQMDARRQFHQEAELLRRLSHPNLPRVVDDFDEFNRSYLVMDFIEGRSLDKSLEAACGALPEHLVLPWMIQVCQVLTYLHGQVPPIIFRDLKPHNMMLTPGGMIKLIDFGIARVYKTGQKRDTVAMGTANYVPPEQFGKGQTDGRSDIYSLGATMYHLLTNSVPPESFLPNPLPLPRMINANISLAVEQSIVKAMARAPEDRYQTAQEMEAALVACQPAGSNEPYCPLCKQPNRATARFCKHCGAHIGGPAYGVLDVMKLDRSAWEMPIQAEAIVIGRREMADGFCPDLDLSYYDQDYVSRRHAQVSQSGGQFSIMDMSSANGTYVNDVLLAPNTPNILRSGDRIRIGRTQLRFRIIG